MESTIGMRIRQLRDAKRLTVAAFAKVAGVKPSAVYGLESGANKPSLETVAALRQSFPGLNTEWLQFGDGEMFTRSLTPAPPDEPTPTPSAALVTMEEPAVAYRPAAPVQPTVAADVLDKLLNQINSAAQQHREELAALKKEHKVNLNGTIRLMQTSANIMAEKIHYMEGRLGLRPLTAAENAQQAIEAPRAKKIGLKHYDESAPVARILNLCPNWHGETSTLLAA